jgi:hypothetical protein
MSGGGGGLILLTRAWCGGSGIVTTPAAAVVLSVIVVSTAGPNQPGAVSVRRKRSIVAGVGGIVRNRVAGATLKNGMTMKNHFL